MVSERSQDFRSRFGEVLVDNGLLSHARRWYRDGEELVGIVDLQGSQFGDYFYVNIGLSIPELDGPGRVTTTNASFGMRIEDFVELPDRAFKTALNLESEMTNDRRFEVIADMVRSQLLPRMSQFRTTSDLRNAIESDSMWRAHSPFHTREYLGIRNSEDG